MLVSMSWITKLCLQKFIRPFTGLTKIEYYQNITNVLYRRSFCDYSGTNNTYFEIFCLLSEFSCSSFETKKHSDFTKFSINVTNWLIFEHNKFSMKVLLRALMKSIKKSAFMNTVH